MKRQAIISLITVLTVFVTTSFSFAVTGNNINMISSSTINASDSAVISLPDGQYRYDSKTNEDGTYTLYEYKDNSLISQINGSLGESTVEEIRYDKNGNKTKKAVVLSDYVTVGVDKDTAEILCQKQVDSDLFTIDKTVDSPVLEEISNSQLVTTDNVSESDATIIGKSKDSEVAVIDKALIDSDVQPPTMAAAKNSYKLKGQYCYKKGYDYKLKKNVKHKGYFKYKNAGTDNVSYTINGKKGTKVNYIASALLTVMASALGYASGVGILATIVIGVCTAAGVQVASGALQKKISKAVSAKATYYRCLLVREDKKGTFPVNPYKSTKYVITSKGYAGKTIYEGVVPQQWKTYAKRLFTVFYVDGYYRTKYPGVEKYVTY